MSGKYITYDLLHVSLYKGLMNLDQTLNALVRTSYHLMWSANETKISYWPNSKTLKSSSTENITVGGG